MRKKLYVDGVDLATFGVYITGTGTYGAPSRKLDTSDIPGRNGAILGIDKSYSNLNVTYPCFVYASLESNLAALRAFLLSRNGYVKIEDDYHTGEYRMGIYEGPFNPTIQRKGDAGSFNLVFNCMPQRFLDSGDVPITGLRSGGTITNPTLFPSLPVINIVNGYSSCTITANGVSMTIAYGSIQFFSAVIDCETMECYDPATGTSYNDKLTSTDFRFIVLEPGENIITANVGANGDVTFIPRWWTL